MDQEVNELLELIRQLNDKDRQWFLSMARSCLASYPIPSQIRFKPRQQTLLRLVVGRQGAS